MATYTVTDPNGKEYEVTAPDSATQDEVLNYAKTQFGTQQKEDNTFMPYLQNDKTFGQAFEDIRQKRGQEVGYTIADLMDRQISGPEAVLQTVGKGLAGTALDVIGEATIRTAKGVGRTISALVPDDIEGEAKQAVAQGWKTLTETPVAKELWGAVEGGIEGYNNWKAQNPQLAKDVESAVNIGLILAPAKTKANAKPTALGRMSSRFERSAEKKIAHNKQKFLQDLVTPKKTKKVLTEEVTRTTETGFGPFKRNVVTPSPREAEIIKEVGKISNVKPSNTIQRNFNNIAQKNAQIAERLKADLGQRRVFTNPVDVKNHIDDAINKMVAENPVIVGSAERTGLKVAAKAKEFIDKNPNNLQGLLQARKDLDAWIKTQKGAKIFDPATENALSISVRTTRQSMNDYLNAMAPSQRVKDQLKRQSLLYDAMENMQVKAAEEANHAVMRAWQNAVKVLPFRGSANQELALLFGMGGLGAAAVFAPYVSAAMYTTLIGAGIGGMAMSPLTRKGIAYLLKMTDKAIHTSKEPSMIKQLRADRAALVNIMKESHDAEETDKLD